MYKVTWQKKLTEKLNLNNMERFLAADNDFCISHQHKGVKSDTYFSSLNFSYFSKKTRPFSVAAYNVLLLFSISLSESK